MGKSKRRGMKNKTSTDPVYDSDDERAYSREGVPDPTADEYFQDEVDEFHAKREKILLDKGAELEPAGFSSEEEEVMGFEDEEEDLEEYERQLSKFRSRGFKDDMASDVEEEAEAGDGLPDEKAWGKKRSKYYGADVSDDEDIDFSGSEPDAALLEEQEALVIQQRMAEQLEEQDFGLDIFKKAKKPKDTETEEKISKDLSTLSKREKLQLLTKESPELLHLIEDYKIKMAEVQNRLLPIFTLIKKGVLPQSGGTDYVQTKLRLSLNYCINLTFYVMLMARRSSVQNHPVIGRLVQYRNLLKQLEPAEKNASAEMDKILRKLEKGEAIKLTDYAADKPVSTNSTLSKRRKLLKVTSQRGDASVSRKTQSTDKRKLSEMVVDSDSDEEKVSEDATMPTGGRTWGRKRGKPDEQTDEANFHTTDEKEALEFYEMLKAGRKKKGDQNLGEYDDEQEDNYEEEAEFGEEQEDGNEDGKRAITYQIEKNKGLTPKRKREQRNPRVKHRMKYRKAKIRRKGQVREVRTEVHKYSGEMSGIRAGVKKGVRLR